MDYTPIHPGDQVIDVVERNYNLLPLLSRFSLPLGFGNKTVEALCRENGINPALFVLIVNFMITGHLDESSARQNVRPTEVVDFLHNSHEYFLQYKFPHIRSILLQALDRDNDDINPAIVTFFDALIKQVEAHFTYEESVVFPYIRSLETGSKSDYSIDVFRRQHDDEINATLRELKNVILRYYVTTLPNRMYDVLVDIYNVEDDLRSHTIIENRLLVPLVKAGENRHREGRTK